MKKFEKGDRVFDARYGWGDLFAIDKEGFHFVTFDNESRCCYSPSVAIKVLSYAEYSLEEPEVGSWDSIYKEWSDYDSDLKYREYLNENFEPPVRKCK